MYSGVKEIVNRTDTDLEWETKQNKTKQNRGVNVQSIVYASVECDSLHLWSSGGVLLICSLSGEINWAHIKVAQLGNRENKGTLTE